MRRYVGYGLWNPGREIHRKSFASFVRSLNPRHLLLLLLLLKLVAISRSLIMKFAMPSFPLVGVEEIIGVHFEMKLTVDLYVAFTA